MQSVPYTRRSYPASYTQLTLVVETKSTEKGSWNLTRKNWEDEGRLT